MNTSLSTIESKICAYRGVITSIDFEEKSGTVDLGGNIGEVSCDFNYMGQHWIWNKSAYSDEHAADHSVFAFCLNDLVIVIKQALPIAEQTETTKVKYTCVAVLEEDGSAIVKRYVWPLFRFNTKGIVLGAEYTDELDIDSNPKECGFPFMISNTRELINEYTDQEYNPRALGTFVDQDGTFAEKGNTKLVITKEGTSNFVAHPACEFMEEGDQFNYTPDALMQSEPNYKGRIIGLSADDELLLDNIPIATVNVDTIDENQQSRYYQRHRVIHIDEQNSIITLLYITIDFQWAYYTNHEIYEEAGYFPPPYAFRVSKGQLIDAELCIYSAMNKETLPEITLVADTDASWAWDDMLGIPYEASLSLCEKTWGYNLVQDFEVAYAGKDFELVFYGIDEITEYTALHREPNWLKIAFRISTNEDGTYQVNKEKTDNGPLFGDYVHEYRQSVEYTYSTSTPSAKARKQEWKDSLLSLEEGEAEFILAEVDGNKLVRRLVASGSGSSYNDYHYPYYSDGLCTYTASWDSVYEEIYVHIDSSGVEWEIGRSYVSTDGNIDGTSHWTEVTPYNWERTVDTLTRTIVCTAKYLLFTHIDVRNGIYSYFLFTPFDDQDITEYEGDNGLWPYAPPVEWHHYIAHQGIVSYHTTYYNAIPSGDPATMTDEEHDTRYAYNKLFNYAYITISSEESIYGEQISVIPPFDLAVKIYIDSAYPGGTLTDPAGNEFYGTDASPYPGIFYIPMHKWWYDTASCYTMARDLCEDPKGLYPEYNAHPFSSASISNYRWPRYWNTGYPHVGVYIINGIDETCEAGLIYCDECVTKTGISYGNNQYKYTLQLLSALPVTIESANLSNLFSCTKRNDLVLKL